MRQFFFALTGVFTLIPAAHAASSPMGANRVTQGYYQIHHDKDRERIEVVSTDSAGNETGRMIGDVSREARLARFTATFGEDCRLGFTPTEMKILVVEDIAVGAGVCEIMPLPTALRAK